MTLLNVCFIGIGSIAKRHIKNLHAVCNRRNISLHIDAVRQSSNLERTDEVPEFRKIYTDYSAIDTEYDVVFITNPTEYHLGSLKKMMPWGRHFFIEKPVVSIHQIEDMESLQLNDSAVYYVACPLRYHAVIQYIKNNIDFSKVLSVRSISSSYLPDWRPDTDYRKTYSADKKLGGGVAIDLIHEWDYLVFLAGMPQKISCMSGRKSNLEINSEDYAIYIAEYSNKIIELHLDYFGRKTIREIMLITENDTIRGDLINQQIEFMKTGKTIAFSENRDVYQIRELLHFLDMIEGKATVENDINHALKILKLTQGELE